MLVKIEIFLISYFSVSMEKSCGIMGELKYWKEPINRYAFLLIE